MPLKLIQRPGSSLYYLRGTVRRQRVFESTGTSDPERAEGFRAKREAELWDRSVYGARAVVTFGKAVRSYLDEDERSDATKGKVSKLLKHFGNCPLQEIDQEALDKAYAAILTAEAGSASRVRTVLTPLRAILEHAAIRKWCERPAFKKPKVTKAVTPYLLPHQASALIQSATGHLRTLLVFQLATGCRMCEALELEWDRVDLQGARAVVWQKQANERLVELPPVAIAALSALGHREGAVFRRPFPEKKKLPEGWLGYASTGRASGGQIGTAWATACRRAGLPGEWRVWTPKGKSKPLRAWVPEHTPHDMRHSWATWKYCIDHDLIRLRDEGGWSTINMVTRYAKRMPDAHRQAAVDWFAGRGVSEVKETA